MPLGFLRRYRRRQGPLAIREARESDYPDIEELLARAHPLYSGLGGGMREAVQDNVTLLAWQEEKLAGVVTAHRQGPEVAWLHTLGLAEDVSVEEVGLPLLQALAAHLAQEGSLWLAYMDEHSLAWMCRLLERAGFYLATRVVGYEAPAQMPPDMGNREVEVRPAGPGDIAAIAQVDRAAFGPLWAYTEALLGSVLGQVGCFLVGKLGNETVGYVLCTLHEGNRGHVVRLAVEPGWQGQRIGARLLAEAFLAMRAQGVRWISLNTQEENRRSQRLYRWFGFRPTGEEVGVWARRLREEK